LEQFLDRVLGCVARARNGANLAFDCFVARLKHFLREINSAVASGLGSNERAAPVQAFSGQYACKLVSQPFVLAEKVPDLSAADADISGRHVGIWTNVPK
jgi:hypothetical protein